MQIVRKPGWISLNYSRRYFSNNIGIDAFFKTENCLQRILGSAANVSLDDVVYMLLHD
jgi:hypothetical protein